MTDSILAPWEDLKQQMLIEAVEYYIYRMKEDNCNEVAIEIYTKLLEELEQE
jgi:hypothetical protein